MHLHDALVCMPTVLSRKMQLPLEQPMLSGRCEFGFIVVKD